MRRLFVSILSLVLLLGVLFGLGVRPASHAGAKTTASSFVGSWRTTISAVGRPVFSGLSTYGADGTLFSGQPPAQPAPKGAPFKLVFSSEGHGVWTSTGKDTAAITFVVLQTDENGNAIDTLTVRGISKLAADGQSFTGTFVTSVVTPGGKVVGGGPGTLTATRITVEPMASPTS